MERSGSARAARWTPARSARWGSARWGRAHSVRSGWLGGALGLDGTVSDVVAGDGVSPVVTTSLSMSGAGPAGLPIETVFWPAASVASTRT